MKPLKLAISTCPNDTFAFHAIMNGQVDLRGLQFEIELLDIEQLNAGLIAGRFDIAKASFHAALRLANETVVLPSGAALGFGVGPLLLSASSGQSPDSAGESSSITLCPGELTTATLLFKMFYGSALREKKTELVQTIFSDIMPALESGTANFGVCIHEGRFTWQACGLHLVEDLGERWERATGHPLPLGGILARRSIPLETLTKAQAVIQDSIQYGLSHREQTLPTMRRYARELNDDVLFQHVDLYVNQWTVDMGMVGRQALRVLEQQARAAGIVEPNMNQLALELDIES